MIARMLSATAFAALLATAASAQTAVPIGHFDGVELSGGGHIVFRHGPVQRVVILKGSAQITKLHIENSKLVVDICDNNCPTHYDFELEITTPAIQSVSVNGGGDIDVAPGFPAQQQITAAIQGGGRIDTRNMDAGEGNAAVNGGGEIHIKAHNALTTAVNGGGEIFYSGSPSVTTAINGGGDVNREGG
jgi:hypothetical protein